ncbi:MAG TPA: tetratricopeptide repeat protein [Gaiellaceae bacterium]|nr:tetratricopeptide repeat protein [Gaiellaceae bacterium]
MRRDFPSGTVTFLFTDVEGSTELLHELGADAYAGALAEHRRFLREAFKRHGGVEVDTQGDAFFVAFPTAPGALAAARDATEALAATAVRVRIGVHTGTPLVTEEGYVGIDVHRAARIAAAGHGGQVLVSASTAVLADAELRDLGEHRFKDLQAAERIYQLGEEEFPPLKSLYRTNLPVPSTPFLGREPELAEVVRLLAREDVRLLTLTGPGGTGKTRLALQAAAEAADDFPDGVWWVPLAPLRDPSLLLPAVAQTLGVTEEPDTPLAETLTAALGGKEALLLLDNAEHLLPAAAREIAALRSAAGPLLLVTTRERLQLQGEQLYPVPTLRESEGVELFLARARALDPGFESNGALGDLCSRLDKLPLAIELAAARTPLFTPEQLVERLSQRLDLLKAGRDADPRQQTLRATIQWSYDLLDSDEQGLFRGLSVFAGGCTFEAAHDVCGADPDTLQSLLDKSLVRRRVTEAGPRYWMLETMREYAVERLTDEGENLHLQRRHAEWAGRLAERAGDVLSEALGQPELNRLDSEYGNVNAALAFAASRDPDLTATIAASLHPWWTTQGRYAELERWVEPLLERDLTPLSRAKVLSALISIAAPRSDGERLQAYGQELQSLSRAIGADALAASAVYALGGAAFIRGDVEQGRALFLEAIDIARRVSPSRVPRYLGSLGWALRSAGELAEARQLLDEALELGRREGNPYRLPLILAQRANLALDESEFAEALALYREALALCREFANRKTVPICLSGISVALAGLGRREEAARIAGAADRMGEEMTLWSPADEEDDEQSAELRDRLGEERYAMLTAEGGSLSEEDAIAFALSAASGVTTSPR